MIESDGRRCRMLRFGALRATRRGPEHFPERLHEIHTMLSELIEEFQPHGVAVDDMGDIFIADKSTGLFHTFTCFKNTTNEADQQYFDKYSDAISSGFTPCPICKPQPEKAPTTLALIHPLFYRDEAANATYYNNRRLDLLMDEISTLDENLKASRQDKFEEIGRVLHEDLPIVPLFYITKL